MGRGARTHGHRTRCPSPLALAALGASFVGEGVTHGTISGGVDWTIVIDDPPLALREGAVDEDGGLVVTSSGNHAVGWNTPGRLARVLDDAVVFNEQIDAVTPPVLGPDRRAFVGTHSNPSTPTTPGVVHAYDIDSGVPLWSRHVTGVPNDLLVGDDGQVYVLSGPAGSGFLTALAQTDGTPTRIVTQVPGAYEAILRDATVFTSGEGWVTAIPVTATEYNPSSSWPVRMHDNQRTASALGPG